MITYMHIYHFVVGTGVGSQELVLKFLDVLNPLHYMVYQVMIVSVVNSSTSISVSASMEPG